jgi:hypothetical protein
MMKVGHKERGSGVHTYLGEFFLSRFERVRGLVREPFLRRYLPTYPLPFTLVPAKIR